MQTEIHQDYMPTIKEKEEGEPVRSEVMLITKKERTMATKITNKRLP